MSHIQLSRSYFEVDCSQSHRNLGQQVDELIKAIELGNIAQAQILLQEGIQTGDLEFLFEMGGGYLRCPSSDDILENINLGNCGLYIGIDYLEWQKTVDEVTKHVKEISVQAKILSAVLKNPSAKVLEQIQAGINSYGASLYRVQPYTPFFMWMSLEEHQDLFDCEAVRLLWKGDKAAALSATKYAACNGETEFFSKFDQYPDLMDDDIRMIALVAASAAGQTDLLSYLLKLNSGQVNFDVSFPGVTKVSSAYVIQLAANHPLFWAVRHGHVAAARILLEAGYPVDKIIEVTGQTSLMIAVERKDKAMVKLLLEYKANPKYTDSSFHTPISRARELDDSEEILRVLKGAKGGKG